MQFRKLMGLLVTTFITNATFALSLNIQNIGASSFIIAVPSEHSTIQEVKEQIKKEKGLDVADQRLFKNSIGKIGSVELENDKTLANYDVKDGNTISLIIIAR